MIKEESQKIAKTSTDKHLWSFAIHHYETSLLKENKIAFVDYYSSKNYSHVA